MEVLLNSMQEIQGRIEMFHSISLVFLIFAVILLIAAVAEFFLLDMMQILRIWSGSAAKKGIRRLEAENAARERMQRMGRYRRAVHVHDYSDGNITMPLEEDEKIQIGQFVIETDIMMIHTDESI